MAEDLWQMLLCAIAVNFVLHFFVSEKEAEESRLKKEKEKNDLRKKQLQQKEDEKIRKEKRMN